MNGNLMDTNVIVRILNGDQTLVQQLLSYNSLCTCSIVLGELLYGAAKSARSQENKDKAKAFCSHFNLLQVDENVSEAYGTIKNELLKHGKVLPENDMWIAATALANDMAVITQDKHFSNIPDLKIIKM